MSFLPMYAVLPRWRYLDPEQRKLTFSICTNFLTRVPGVVGLLWLLPLVHAKAGTDNYTILLSSYMLGYAAAFLSGGMVLIGRRLVGEAYAKQDQQGEADSFISLAVANLISVLVGMVLVAGYCVINNEGTAYTTIAMLSAAGFIFNPLDSTRSAYNEHYVNALLMIAIQSTVFLIGFLVEEAQRNIILAFLVFQSPYWLTGLFTFALMMPRRSYLLWGRPKVLGTVLRQGVMMSLADGLLLCTLSLSVVWLQAVAPVEISAWFATLVRLFTTLLVPVSLLLLPLSSYIRLKWHGKSIRQQQTFTKATLLIGLAYGVFVAGALYVASRLYIGYFLHLPVPNDLSIFVFFGAIIMYKSYSSVAYLVLDEPMHLSAWTSIAVAIGVAFGAVASTQLAPLTSLDIYAVMAGLLVIGVTSWSAVRFVKPALS